MYISLCKNLSRLTLEFKSIYRAVVIDIGEHLLMAAASMQLFNGNKRAFSREI